MLANTVVQRFRDFQTTLELVPADTLERVKRAPFLCVVTCIPCKAGAVGEALRVEQGSSGSLWTSERVIVVCYGVLWAQTVIKCLHVARKQHCRTGLGAYKERGMNCRSRRRKELSEGTKR